MFDKRLYLEKDLRMPAPSPDWYEVLGVRPGASREEILSAYRRLSLACRPDASGDESLIRLVTAARDHLLAGSGRPPRGPVRQPPRGPRPDPRTAYGRRPEPGWDGRDAGYREAGERRYRDRPWRDEPPFTPDRDRSGVPGASHRLSGFLVSLPTPHRFRGWAGLFVAWLLLGVLGGVLLGHTNLIGPLVELCVFVTFPLFIIAALVKAQLRRRVLDYLYHYRRLRERW